MTIQSALMIPIFSQLKNGWLASLIDTTIDALIGRPWILIYTFVILVLVVSVWYGTFCLSITVCLTIVCSVLTLAWHRLYLRGVPKTYNMRLRVLNYISLYVLLEETTQFVSILIFARCWFLVLPALVCFTGSCSYCCTCARTFSQQSQISLQIHKLSPKYFVSWSHFLSHRKDTWILLSGLPSTTLKGIDCQL